MMQTFDFAERDLQTVPLRLELLAAFGDGQGVDELSLVLPKLEFGERRAAGEEVEDGADEGLLLRGEFYAGSAVDVGVFDFELAKGGGGGRRHSGGRVVGCAG